MTEADREVRALNSRRRALSSKVSCHSSEISTAIGSEISPRRPEKAGAAVWI